MSETTPTAQPESLGLALEAYFVDRLNKAREAGNRLDNAEIKTMIAAHESRLIGAGPALGISGSSAEESPPGELSPTATIGFESPWLRKQNGQVRSNGRATG